MFHVNESGLDRVIRIVAGFTMLAASYVNYGIASARPFGLVVGVIGGFLLITGIAGIDLFYGLIGHQTKQSDTMPD